MEEHRTGKRAFKVNVEKIITNFEVRPPIAGVETKVETYYPSERATHGIAELIILQDGQSMSTRMAAASAWLQMQLWSNWKNVVINTPEVFPIDRARCVVLVTGYVPQTIVLS